MVMVKSQSGLGRKQPSAAIGAPNANDAEEAVPVV